MPEQYPADMFVFLRGEIRGKRKLNPVTVNPSLREYRKLLESFKIKETASNGTKLQVSVLDVDEYSDEVLDEKTVLFRFKLKLSVLDTPPRILPQPNYPYNVHMRIREAIMKIKIDEGKYTEKIIILTTGFKLQGEVGTGRWPTEKMVGIGI